MEDALSSSGGDRVGDEAPEKPEVVGMRACPRPMDVVAMYDTTRVEYEMRHVKS